MGTYKSKQQKIKFDDLPEMQEEPDYEVKTRGPLPDTWKLNITRGKREDDLRNEAYQLVRKKCQKKVLNFQQCEKNEGVFWVIFNCIEEKNMMQECFSREYLVEMDKLRRNMDRNPEWWWQNIYDKDGEINEQKLWKSDEMWYHIKFKELKTKINSYL